MRKFNPDPDYSTKRSDRFGETCLYIVKHEDLTHTEAYLSPEFLREYSLTQGFEIECLISTHGIQAFLINHWDRYYLLLAYEQEAVFMMRVDDLDDTDRILSITSRSYLALRTLNHHPPGYQLLLDFDIVDIWGNETTDQWAFHLVGEQDYIIGTKEGKFVDMLFLRNWLYFLVKKYRVTI